MTRQECVHVEIRKAIREVGNVFMQHLAWGLKYWRHLGKKKMKREVESQAVNIPWSINQMITASLVEGGSFFQYFPKKVELSAQVPILTEVQTFFDSMTKAVIENF